MDRQFGSQIRAHAAARSAGFEAAGSAGSEPQGTVGAAVDAAAGLPGSEETGLPEPGPVGIRDVLGESLRRYAVDFPRIYITIAVPMVPALAVSALGGILPLGGSILLILASAATMAIVGAGTGALSVRSAWRRGVFKGLRLYLVEVVIGLLVVPIAVVALIAFSLAGGEDAPIPVRTSIVGAAVLAGGWVYARLALAPVAVVVDGLGVNAALGESRRLTRPRSTMLRVVATLLAASTIVASSYGIPVALWVAGLPIWLAYGVGGFALAAVTPVYLVANVVLYRRLSGAPANDAWDGGSTLPRAGRVRAVAGGLAAIAVIGIVAWGGFVALAASGIGALPAGAVPRGEIRFGTGMVLDECRVTGSATTFSPTDVTTYVATFPRAIRETDDVALEVFQDSSLIATIPQSGLTGATCVGDLEGFSLPAGSFEFRFTVNGDLVASGSMTVR